MEKKLELQYNSIFQINEKPSKQLRGAATALKFAPPYPITFTTDLNEITLEDIKLQSRIWWRYTDDIYFSILLKHVMPMKWINAHYQINCRMVKRRNEWLRLQD